ncbi:MAG: hypothetical protein H6626_01230 [Pseudobdellovibrionaceae bacterium]|nr:hypothetical protein [Bdellovibrionales bacterium]USN47746.1 MAG: hypothetical protein H6626_01230 [Pseudobdellovibrionaceae bacterium]
MSSCKVGTSSTYSRRALFTLMFVFSVGCKLNDNTIKGSIAGGSIGSGVNIAAPIPPSGDVDSAFVFAVSYEAGSTINLNLHKVEVSSTGDVTCDPPQVSSISSSNRNITLENCNGNGTISVTLLPGSSTNQSGVPDQGSQKSTVASIANAVSQQIITSSDGGMDFGSSDVSGGPVIQIITITNDNNRDMTDIVLSGVNAPYNFEGGSFPGTSGTCTGDLAPSESCTIAIEFNPSTPGEYTLDLTMEYTDGDNVRQETLPISGYATDNNSCPDPIFVGPDHLYTSIMSAQRYGSNGDNIIIEPGTYTHHFSLFGLEKNIRLYGATGNPDDVTLVSSTGSTHFMGVFFDRMSDLVRDLGLYHVSVNKPYSNWAPYFYVFGDGDPANHSFTLENIKITGDLGGSNDLVRSAQPGFTQIFNNVSLTHGTKPYTFMQNNSHANFVEVNSLYTPIAPTPDFWNPTNLTIVNNNYSTNSSTHGTSQYGAPSFPCGYTPGVVKPARFSVVYASQGLTPRISWMKSGHATSYKLKIKDSDSNVICPPMTTSNQYYDVTDCELQAGVTYKAEVVAYNGAQLTPAENTLDFTPQASCVGNILHVGGGQTYSTIVDALTAASDGDNIILHPGNHTVPAYTTISKDVRFYGSTGDPDDVSINVDIGSDDVVFHLRADLMAPAQVKPGFYHMTIQRNTLGQWDWFFDIRGKANPDDSEFTFENIKFNSGYPIYNIATSVGSPRLIVRGSTYTADPGRLVNFDNKTAYSYFDSVAYSDTYEGTPLYINNGSVTTEKNDATSIMAADQGTAAYIRRTGSPRFPCGYQP